MARDTDRELIAQGDSSVFRNGISQDPPPSATASLLDTWRVRIAEASSIAFKLGIAGMLTIMVPLDR